MARIKTLYLDTWQGKFHGLIVMDEANKRYKISAGTLMGHLEGRKILKTDKKTIYRHITQIGDK